MRESQRRWRFGPLAVAVSTLIVAAAYYFEPAAAERKLDRDLATVNPAEVGISPERLERLDAGMQKMVDDGQLAGVVTMLARHGKVAFVDVAGMQNIGTGAPMRRDSIFRIYSMSKPITGVAMMMLFEEGKWRLNDPVSKYIPAFADLKVHVGGRPSGSLRLEDARRSMTMRELMSHSAGLAYGLRRDNAVDRLYREERVLNANASLQTMVDKLATLPLLAQPGTRWYYSIAVDVQGYLVEQLSGLALDQFLQERIFEPLGMVDTAFYVPIDKLDRVALIYTIRRQWHPRGGRYGRNANGTAGRAIGRRRLMGNCRRLPSVHTDDAEWRRARRCASAGAAYCRDDANQPSVRRGDRRDGSAQQRCDGPTGNRVRSRLRSRG